MDDADFDFAYYLQLEEAISASLAHHTQASSSAAASSSAPRQDHPEIEHSHFAVSAVDEFAELEQIFMDRKLRHETSDSMGEMLVFPDEDWDDDWDDDSCQSRDTHFSEGCSKSAQIQGVFRVYFKGLVSEESLGDKRSALGGIGIALCDSRDNLIFEETKPLIGNGMSKICAEAKALIEGLTAALALGLERVVFYCDYYPLFQFVTRRWPPKQRKIVVLLNQVSLLRNRFVSCKANFAARHDIKFAFKLAREAIVSQITGTKDPAQDKKLTESCVICLEDCDVNKMFSIDVCLHRYCISCMKQHVEVKLLQGVVPRCPHEGCKVDLNVDSCAKFLTPKDITTMRLRIKEASVPSSEKVYCPYPRCSAFMSKGEVSVYTRDVLGDANESGVRKCMKCHGLFCINCKVPWHSRISCNDYKKSQDPTSEDVKMKSLASRNLWRQCAKCNHMIELAEGCYHMTCRCGYEFCYNCGAGWKNKKATCSCPLWDEDHILFEDRYRDEDEEDEEEEELELYDSDENYYFFLTGRPFYL